MILKGLKKIGYELFGRPLMRLYAKILPYFPKLHTQHLYRQRFGEKLDLNAPKTLNEKVLWLKFHEYHKPIYTQCADKYRVRDFVEERGCGELLNKLYGVYTSADEIDFNTLPNQFALKCNHAAGFNIICEDKHQLDIPKVKKQLNDWLQQDFSRKLSEPQYREIPRRIICEKFIDNGSELPDDFKFYCINGVPKVVMLCRERSSGETKFYYFDMNWHLLPFNETSREAIATSLEIPRPDGFARLTEYAKALSQGFIFVRADFYLVNNKPLFGELTFTPAGGLDRTDREANIEIGKMIQLPLKTSSYT